MTPDQTIPGPHSTQQNPPIPPELSKTPQSCPACDMMVTLGLLTSSCESIKDPTKKNMCKTLLNPLESGSTTAVDALANVIVELGEEHLDDVVERMNLLMYEATAKAKDKLIESGILNKDGTKKE